VTLPPSVRCCLFDAVGTLIRPRPPVGVAYHEAARRYGCSLSGEEIGARFRLAFRRQESLDAAANGGATDEARERRRWQTIVAEVFDDLADTTALFDDLWSHFADPRHWRLFDDVAETWRALAAKGIRLGVASNFDARLRGVCAGLPPLDRCSSLFVSSELGVRKPSPDFFRRIERALGLPSEQIALVGDDWNNDYLAAQAAGWRAIYLDRGSQPPATAGPIQSLRALIGFGEQR